MPEEAENLTIKESTDLRNTAAETASSEIKPLNETNISMTIENRKRAIDEPAEDASPEKKQKFEFDLPSSTTLLIKNLKRPFALQSLKDMLSSYGNVTEFWINSIKTHCFVTFEQLEDAQNAFKQLHGKQWPSNTGKLLSVEGVAYERAKEMQKDDDEKSKSKRGGRSGVLGGLSNIFAKATKEALNSTAAVNPVEIKTSLNTTSNEINAEQAKEEELPVDVLFKKTLTQPHIYYLPLTDKQVAAKKNQVH